MAYHIHCLMTNGGSLDDAMRSKLYQVARDMLLANKTSQTFRTKIMEGLVVTENKKASIGHLFGTICEADIDSENSDRTITVHFIITKPYVPNELIERWEWVSLEEFLEQEEMEDKRWENHPATNAHLN